MSAPYSTPHAPSGQTQAQFGSQLAPPGWYPDPSGANSWAWWSGTYWVSQQPLGNRNHTHSSEQRQPEHKWVANLAPLRIEAAYLAFIAALVLLAMNMIGSFGSGATVAIVGIVSLGYSIVGFPLVAWFACRHYGSGSMIRDLELKPKWRDVPIGFAGAIALYLGVVAISILTWISQLPDGSNLSEAEDLAKEDPGVRIFMFLFLFVLAGIIAPITEELLFRGALMRGLMSKFGRWSAVVIQGVFFGSVHFTPSQGLGNVSMLFALSTVGIGLGVLTQMTGRLAPAVVAHSVFNCTSLALLWVSL